MLISYYSQEITGGRGVDVAVEALGKALTFSQCTQSVRDGGKAVMIGLAATNVVGEVDITRLVRRQVHNLAPTKCSQFINPDLKLILADTGSNPFTWLIFSFGIILYLFSMLPFD
jgi:threonine dehydrogenase-like Zn-dependent dehydrogenase